MQQHGRRGRHLSGLRKRHRTRFRHHRSAGHSPHDRVGPAQPRPGGRTLPANDNGYVYIETQSGMTRCQISADTVGCESEFSDSPIVDGENANGVEVSASGSNRWLLGNLGAMPTTTIGYDTYRAVGWTIVADSGGTTFTNDGTGHGMFVSTERVDFF